MDLDDEGLKKRKLLIVSAVFVVLIGVFYAGVGLVDRTVRSEKYNYRTDFYLLSELQSVRYILSDTNDELRGIRDELKEIREELARQDSSGDFFHGVYIPSTEESILKELQEIKRQLRWAR